MDPTGAVVAQTAAERFWALSGTVGDTVGGLANLATFVIVVISFRYARREVRRNREQHAAELRADAARTAWRSTMAYARDASGLIKALSDPPHVWQRMHEHYLESMLEFRKVSADASLFFDDSVTAALTGVALVCGEAGELKQTRHEEPERLATLQKTLWERAFAVRDLLRPHATLGSLTE